MITFEQSRACLAHLAALHDVTIVEPDSPGHAVAYAVLDALSGTVPLLAPLVVDLRGATERVSVTVPTPLGTLVILSKSALADPVTLLATGLHELVHATQIARVGKAQSVADYLGSGELRALREAEASGVGLWARYLVTGTLPPAEDAGVLRSDLYHLDGAEKAFAREVVVSVRTSAALGVVPPFRVAREAALWLRENAPGAIAGEVAS